ncbi:hypothetical protein [Aureimonas sp. ME7]|uniref:hypothetical protein n=1 Tax=Aureimonas sp. ME7 TaxID=2744252 RepID=UPI0015F9C644|nr:hypothetical protein [Aureimonas sp. ME7]
MSLTPDENASGDRLLQVNDAPWDRLKNAFGLGRDGYSRGVFTGALHDMVIFVRGAVSLIAAKVSAMETIATRFEAAVAAIQTGPVTSVNGQVGAVTVDTSLLEGAVDDKLAEVDTALADVAAANAAIRTNAAAYSLAFGG